MKTYFIVQQPEQAETKQIYIADDGTGYVKNNELHLTSTQTHYIYKFVGSPVGWYARNGKTGKDYYLGFGASPTINLNGLEILDGEFWASIIYEPEQLEEVEL